MAKEYRRVKGSHRAIPNNELLANQFGRENNTNSLTRIYADGWCFVNINSLVFFDNATTPFLGPDNLDVQAGDPPANVKPDYKRNDPNRHPWLIPVAHLFVLPTHNQSDPLEKATYKGDSAYTVLPIPKDVETFVRSFVMFHSAQSKIYDGSFPAKKFCDDRQMHFYEVVIMPFWDDAIGDNYPGKFQDPLTSHTFFRQFMRYNSARELPSFDITVQDPNNGNKVHIL